MKGKKEDKSRQTPTMRRERKTIEAMIHLYCRSLHGRKGDLCADCRELSAYALERLDRCPFREEKPTCANCTIHCYNPAMREKIRTVMRYTGPRMSGRHPILTLHHLRDARKKPPSRKV